MKSSSLIIMSVVTSAFVFASCSGTRNLTPPSLDLPETIADYSADSMSYADLGWWEYYTDPALRTLISRALENNRDLLIAAARVEELRRLYGIEKVNYMPTVTGSFSGSHETNDYYGERFKPDSELGLKATVSWEADLWGALSYAKKRSAAQFLGSVEDMRAMQMTVIAEVASSYFRLAALEQELNIVRMTLSTRREALDKAKLRFESGLTSETVYQQAKVEYATTAAYVPDLERRIEVTRNAISLLVGAFPGEIYDIAQPTLDEHLPEKIPVGLPSSLLERRPDIRSAEQKLKGALAGCGVAYSNRFPRIRIAVTGGWENDEVADLLKSPFSYVLGNITGTIFDFGRNKRKYQAAIAAYEQARLSYEKCVLNAFREVNDAVTTYRKLREAAELRSSLRGAALKYVELANIQYLAGTLNYIDVLDAQRRYFDARVSLSNAVRDEYLALVNIYKVLGGGWSASDTHQ